jgi:hypothetical protein
MVFPFEDVTGMAIFGIAPILSSMPAPNKALFSVNTSRRVFSKASARYLWVETLSFEVLRRFLGANDFLKMRSRLFLQVSSDPLLSRRFSAIMDPDLDSLSDEL